MQFLNRGRRPSFEVAREVMPHNKLLLSSARSLQRYKGFRKPFAIEECLEIFSYGALRSYGMRVQVQTMKCRVWLGESLPSKHDPRPGPQWSRRKFWLSECQASSRTGAFRSWREGGETHSIWSDAQRLIEPRTKPASSWRVAQLLPAPWVQAEDC